MSLGRLLIANRGEVAIRIAHAAAGLGIPTVAIYSEDDALALHTRRADAAEPLRGSGPAAYLDIEQIVSIATSLGCDGIHPGYGFLSENAAFASRCAEAGLAFAGPQPDVLELLGDKARARALASEVGVPVLAGTAGATTLDEARTFFEGLGPGGAVVIKAIAGGGGRGMRVVEQADALAAAYERCRSEARAAFGNADVYVEELMRHARHIEVQVAGDSTGNAIHLWERDCSVQRRHQKLIEVAPGPTLAAATREALLTAALGMAQAARLRSLATFEFLVDATDGERFVFIEANPRLQVEHTVTEAVTGIDLVQLQLRLAGGETFASLGIAQENVPAPRGYAIQARVNMERMTAEGAVRPAPGRLTAFDPPAGPGVRVDTHGYTGYDPGQRFDSLLAKVIVHAPGGSFEEALAATGRALAAFRIVGPGSNLAFLQGLLAHPAMTTGTVYTRFIDDHAAEIIALGDQARPRYIEQPPGEVVPAAAAETTAGRAGQRVDSLDPLAVLAFGKQEDRRAAGTNISGPDQGALAVAAPMQGTIVSVAAAPGSVVASGQELFVLEAMKMEHVIAAPASGVLRAVHVEPGMAVVEGAVLALIDGQDGLQAAATTESELDLDRIRPDLAEVEERHARTLDAARPESVARRRATGQRTIRENIEALLDPGSFVEYGQLALAAQRRRRSIEELIAKTPADGLVAGTGTIDGQRCAVIGYDYTVLAGTQGHMNHLKTDRVIELAEKWRLPLVLFAEGGGGRPGDTEGIGTGMSTTTFHLFGRLSGLVPLVGITSGKCYAGNASLLGCCDVVIATADANIGMGGPAMVEGGGLGVFRPEEIGPMEVQVPNGVVDIAVADEDEAVAAARHYLGYFHGPAREWQSADQRRLRSAIPENRLRVYDIRSLITTLVDTGSLLEMRPRFGRGMVTALARIEGHPLGIIANNPAYLSGAVDSDGADKAARFMQVCDAFDIPILTLCDTPGIMVGPEIEKSALVRHSSRMFVTAASVTVPIVAVVLRKFYGLGAIAMAGGGLRVPAAMVSWPTGEFGGMGLEGAVKLAYRSDLAAIDDPAERRVRYDEMVAREYERGKALNVASMFDIDDVIDPAETRTIIARTLSAVGPPPARNGRKRPCIDPW